MLFYLQTQAKEEVGIKLHVSDLMDRLEKYSGVMVTSG